MTKPIVQFSHVMENNARTPVPEIQVKMPSSKPDPTVSLAPREISRIYIFSRSQHWKIAHLSLPWSIG